MLSSLSWGLSLWAVDFESDTVDYESNGFLSFVSRGFLLAKPLLDLLGGLVDAPGDWVGVCLGAAHVRIDS